MVVSTAAILSGTAANLFVESLFGRDDVILLHKIQKVAQTLWHISWAVPSTFLLKGIFEAKAFP